MFGSSSTPISEDAALDEGRPSSNEGEPRLSGEKPTLADGNMSTKKEEASPGGERKRRSSGVSRARDMFSSAKQSLHLHSNASPTTDKPQSPIQKLSRADPALGVPQGSHNNSAGESAPTSRSTFRVGVTEDKNKKCRRTMEDTHAYLYNFLSTPAPAAGGEAAADLASPGPSDIVETDNGYFAIFDGHAGTFAADWCGKKLHHILEDTIRKNPNTPIPELLDQTFTSVDQQLEKLPLKNSGCTAVIAVLRWEDRVPNPASATGSTYLNHAAAKATNDPADEGATSQGHADITTANPNAGASESKLLESASRQRVLYTANVGDARIVLCRNGRALRLSYDHKGSDENEGRRVANAGGLILNNRVNGVLAVTRALGDAYMKDLVTGHPYTTETVIQPDQDEFIILACDGLWDVCTDQEAVDLIRSTPDPQAASKQLVDHALARFSTDNLSCMIVRFDNDALKRRKEEAAIGVEGDATTQRGGQSEAQAIVKDAKRQLDETGGQPIGDGLTGTAAVEAGELDLEKREREGEEPGPELNPEALKAAREKTARNVERLNQGS